MNDTLVTVIEHPNYLRRAEKLLTSEQMDEIANMIAADPRAGDIMQGTGGFRKLRYAGVEGKGKSAGVRVIHLLVIKNDSEQVRNRTPLADCNNVNFSADCNYK